MTREERILEICEQFDREAKGFCEKTGGLHCEIIPFYKGEAIPEHLEFRFAGIYYSSFIVEFKYTVHSTMSLVNSILECMVYLGKSEECVAIPLSMLLDYCEVDMTAPPAIPLITDAESMQTAYTLLGDVLCQQLPMISKVCNDQAWKERVLRAYFDEIAAWLKLTSEKTASQFEEENPIIAYLNDGFYSLVTLRLVGAPFINALKGDLKTAVKQLEKTKLLLGFENRFLRLWKEQGAAAFSLPTVSENAKTYSKSGVANASGKEFLSIFLSWLVLTPVLSPIYAGIYCLLVFFEGMNSVYLMGPIYNLPYCICVGLLTSIPVSYFTRHLSYRLLFRRDYERFRACDHIQNGSGGDKLIKWLLIIIVAGSLALSVLLAKWNLNFGENGFTDNSDFFSLQGEYHDYAEVERVYYKPDRINGFGETIDIPSYVLVLKDGREIDFHELDDVEMYGEHLIEFLRERGISIDDTARK